MVVGEAQSGAIEYATPVHYENPSDQLKFSSTLLTVMPKSVPTTMSGVKISNPIVILRVSTISDHKVAVNLSSWLKRGCMQRLT